MATFWIRKIVTFFSRIDLDSDGQITRADFQKMAAKFIAGGYVAKDNEANFTSNLCGIWDNYLKEFGANGITQDIFVQAIKKLLNDSEGLKILTGTLTNFFHAVDTDNDGEISKKEFRLFYTIIGLDPEMADASFAIIDENCDDQLSLTEFIDTGLKFFTSEDESSPSTQFWGPLIG